MGELASNGSARPVTEVELARYGEMHRLQSEHRVPVLQARSNPHAHLYVVLFDGTGQNANDPKYLATNIGKLKSQLDLFVERRELRVGRHYGEGIGTQDNPVARALDGVVAHSWNDKIELAYLQLAVQVAEWQHADPQAQVSLVEVGYSRGAVLVPGLARLVDTYGIVDPKSLRFGRDEHGNLTVESSVPPLIAPGQIPQAVGLFDPVATSLPRNYDARLPDSVVSGFSLLAADEQRRWFPHQTVIDPEVSADGRFLGVRVPGGHANVGGGARDDGLEAMAFNGMVDYLNALSDAPLFEKRALPSDPARYTVHQAGGVTAGFGLHVDRDGRRDLRDELANCRIVDPCRDADPVDTSMAGRLQWHTVQPTWSVPRLDGLQLATNVPVPPAPPAPLSPADREHPDHAMLEQVRAGVLAMDRQVGKGYDEASERLSRSLLAASRDHRPRYPDRPDLSLSTTALGRVDHVVLGTDGRHAFAIEGDPTDPAHRRAAVVVEEALRTSIERSDQSLAAANEQIARERGQVPQPTHARAVEAPDVAVLAR